nr:isoprenylcysteine carboxylmethyltransferase family protein [Aliiroseovarius subalbicans]
MKWLDIPPTWLGAAVAAAFGLDWLVPGLGFNWSWSKLLGDGLITFGLGAMALALWEMLRARTTFIPRRVPTAFVQQGIYRLTRNPIYLGDAMILAGLILRWDVLLALPLVPLFAGWITRRFILGEEEGLLAAFGDEFDDWKTRVRRWL